MNLGNDTGYSKSWYTSVLHEIVDFWFPNDEFQSFWFSSEYDTIIREKYEKITNDIIAMMIDDLLALTIDGCSFSQKTFLGIVICLDQFVRNLNRIVIGVNDRSIYKITDNKCISLITFISDTVGFNYPINQRIFILLPYRHQRTTRNLNFVMNQIDIMKNEASNETENKIIAKFKIATLKDYTNVSDEIIHYKNSLVCDSYLNLEIANIVLDDHCLNLYDLSSFDKTNVTNTLIYNIVLNFIKENDIKNVCISLSGGVDSMVLSYVLYQMKKNNVIDNVVAVHLDYSNRIISKDEANIISDWCKFLNIPFIIRKINHMKRSDDIDRSVYEQETKKMRFNLYRHAINLYNVTSVMLGHHMDDLTENVLMNVIQGVDLLNLFTMKARQIIDEIPIDRPLLSIRKDPILDFAHSYSIPYLKDVTSTDCMRGVVRKSVLPLLERFNVRENLVNIGKQSDQWNETINNQLIHPFLSSIQKYKFGFTIKFEESYKEFDFSTWKKLMIELFHGCGTKMMSNCNLSDFINWVKNENHVFFRCPIHLVSFHTQNNQRFLIFHKHNFKTTDGSNETTMNDIMYDNWHITIEKVNEKDANADDVNVGNLLNGEFSYYAMGSRKKVVNYHTRKNKKIFKNINMSRYIPQIHFVFDQNEDTYLYKVSYKYNHQ